MILTTLASITAYIASGFWEVTQVSVVSKSAYIGAEHMKQQNRLYRPSILHGLALALLFFFLVMGFVPKTQAAPMAPDYTITTLGGVLVVTDVSGNGETLTVSEPGGGNILFSVPGRNFSIDGGPDLPGNSGSLSLAGVTSVIINPGNGNDTLNVGAFTGSFPSLTINGDAGNDTINLNGDITFATDANLDLDLQNDSATPGTDVVNLGAGANLLTAGSGTITIKCSWNVTRLQAPAWKRKMAA